MLFLMKLYSNEVKICSSLIASLFKTLYLINMSLGLDIDAFNAQFKNAFTDILKEEIQLKQYVKFKDILIFIGIDC